MFLLRPTSATTAGDMVNGNSRELHRASFRHNEKTHHHHHHHQQNYILSTIYYILYIIYYIL